MLEEIISKIKKQEQIINNAQKEKELLYRELLESEEKGCELITVKQASRLLNVSVGLIYQKINSGEFKSKRLGSAIRLYKSEIEKYGGLV